MGSNRSKYTGGTITYSTFPCLFKLEKRFCDLSGTQHGEEVDSSVEEDNNKLAYSVTDVPPWYLCIVLGIQVFLRLYYLYISPSVM